ncbi:MAG: pyridoxamine 5'-phosphate oxidase family protein [Anaerolineae bacterium]
MLTDAQRTFLQKPLIARISTIDNEGYPHTVPVWFILDGDDLVIFGAGNTRKFGYARANSKGCVTIGGDSDDGEGYLFKGDWTVEADNGWSRKITAHYSGEQRADELLKEWGDLDYAVMRLKIRKAIKV